MDQNTVMNLLALNVSAVNANVKTLTETVPNAINGLSAAVNVLLENVRELSQRLEAVEATLAASQPKPKAKATSVLSSTDASPSKVTKKSNFTNFNLWVRSALASDFSNMENNFGKQTTVFSTALGTARGEVRVPKGKNATEYVGSEDYNKTLAGKLYNVLHTISNDSANPDAAVVNEYFSPLRKAHEEAKKQDATKRALETVPDETNVADILTSSSPSA